MGKDDMANNAMLTALEELAEELKNTSISQRRGSLDDKEMKLFMDRARTTISEIDDEAVLESRLFSVPQKDYLLWLKYGDEYRKGKSLKKSGKRWNICFNEKALFCITASNFFSFRILEIRNGSLIMEGVNHVAVLGEGYRTVAKDEKGHRFYPEEFPWRHKDTKGFDGATVVEGKRLHFEIPLKKKPFELTFYIEDPNGKTYKLKPTYGLFAKLNPKMKAGYYARDGYIVRYNGGSLEVQRARKKAILKAELNVQRELIKEKKIKIALLRLIGVLYKLLRKKPLWLIRDNEKRATDSGAEMFRYYSRSGLKDKADAVFVLDKKSKDYPELKKYGKIIQPYSLKYKIMHLACNVVIDTRGNISARYVFQDDYRYFLDLCDWDYVWLIHGVMARNFAEWMNLFEFNSKLVATTTRREYQSVLDDISGYGYTEKEVKLTGLPRHDTLTDNKQKKILFLPTWRRDLAGRIIPGTDERYYVEGFRETDFAKFYNGLINNERLISVMKEHGYSGDFYLHPSFIKQVDDFDSNDVIRVGREPADANRLICECSVLVTDYSSAQFEGAYLNRPVVYSQFDADTYNERHTGANGYFSWEDDVFGPVCHDVESTVDAIIKYIENGCENTEPYTSRAKDFFAYRDKDNSRRVYDEILKLK